MAEIALADAIRALRQQLGEATSEGEGQHLRFAVTSLELQLSVTMTKTGEGHAGIRFWVVDAGAKGQYEDSAVQRVTLRLLPVDERGRPVVLADESTERPT
jgi:hypothetical protein